MAMILEFRASTDQNKDRKPRARGRRRSAEIVIFPGVRYEHWDEPETGEAAVPVQRDTLVLAE